MSTTYMRYLLTLILLTFGVVGNLYATGAEPLSSTPKRQEFYRTAPTGGMLYRVTPDARGAALGGIGLASSPDAFALHYNMSKLAFTDKNWGLTFGFTPWMGAVAKDMNISNLFGYYSWGQKSLWQHAVSGGVRYFNMGKATVFPPSSIEGFEIQPYELAVDLGYAFRYGKHWAVGLSVKYLKSDYNTYDGGPVYVAHNILFDASLTYQTAVPFEGLSDASLFRAAIALNNIGDKIIIHKGHKHFPPPVTLRVGAGLELPITLEHHVGLYAESNTLLVPAMPTPDMPKYQEELRRYLEESVLQGITGSEPSHLWRQTALSLGAEYAYKGLFYGRLGYKLQRATYRADSGLSLGGGLRYKGGSLDLSYFLAKDADSPLNGTLRFTVGVDF